MSKPQFPMRIVKENSRVTIYHHKNGEYDEFKLAYFKEGRRKFETLATFEKAKIRADAINDSVNSGRLELLSLSRSQCEEYGQAAELVVSSGLTLPSVALQFMDARKILGGVSIVEAAQFYKKHHQDVIAKTIPQIR